MPEKADFIVKVAVTYYNRSQKLKV